MLVISLLRSIDRRESARKQLADLGIAFEFLDAVDGRIAGHPLLERYEERQFLVNCGRTANVGELGCYASHFLAWQRCVSLDEPVLVLEDDFLLEDGFPAALALCERLLPVYGYLRLEKTTRSRAVRQRDYGRFTVVKYIKAPQGAMCYGIAPPAARLLIRHSNAFAFPVDVFVRNVCLHRLPLFGLTPYTVAYSELSQDSLIGERQGTPKHPWIGLVRFLGKVFRFMMNGKENLLYAVGVRRPSSIDGAAR